MIVAKRGQIRRTLDVSVTFDVPEALKSLPKDVSISFHSDDIARDPRAQCAPWTDAVRIVGAEGRFVVRMKVPVGTSFLLHAVVLIDEPGIPADTVTLRRHMGFADLRVNADARAEVGLCISHFETYTLVMPTAPPASRAA